MALPKGLAIDASARLASNGLDQRTLRAAERFPEGGVVCVLRLDHPPKRLPDERPCHDHPTCRADRPGEMTQFLRVVRVTVSRCKDALDRCVLDPDTGRLKAATDEQPEVSGADRAKRERSRRTRHRLISVGKDSGHQMLPTSQ